MASRNQSNQSGQSQSSQSQQSRSSTTGASQSLDSRESSAEGFANHPRQSASMDSSGLSVQDSLASAISTVFQNLEPQINEFTQRLSHQAVDQSRALVSRAYAKAQKQPWYLVGAAAILLVGAAMYLGFGERQSVSDRRVTH